MLSLFGRDPWEDLLTPTGYVSIIPHHGMRPRHNHRHGYVVKKDGVDQFSVKMDVQQFRPEELNVKVQDNFLVVEGKHEEKMDEHGFISRQFTRRYQLPDNLKPELLTSNLSSDGVLQISAPLTIEDKGNEEKTIPILQTGQPAIVEEKKVLDKAFHENTERKEG